MFNVLTGSGDSEKPDDTIHETLVKRPPTVNYGNKKIDEIKNDNSEEGNNV